MDDLHTDGNAIAGLLSQLLAVDATSIDRRCQSCGDQRPIADHRAYHGAGVVLRCPSCSDVALIIGTAATKVTIELRGTFQVAVRP
jgi:Family of unknown function (DUF6510)